MGKSSFNTDKWLRSFACLIHFGFFSIVATAQTPASWTGEAGITILPGPVSATSRVVDSGDVVLEARARHARTARLCEDVLVTEFTTLPRNTPLYARRLDLVRPFAEPYEGISQEPFAWCAPLHDQKYVGRERSVCIVYRNEQTALLFAASPDDPRMYATNFRDLAREIPLPCVSEQFVSFSSHPIHAVLTFRRLHDDKLIMGQGIRDGGKIVTDSFTLERADLAPVEVDYWGWKLVFSSVGSLSRRAQMTASKGASVAPGVTRPAQADTGN